MVELGACSAMVLRSRNEAVALIARLLWLAVGLGVVAWVSDLLAEVVNGRVTDAYLVMQVAALLASAIGAIALFGFRIDAEPTRRLGNSVFLGIARVAGASALVLAAASVSTHLLIEHGPNGRYGPWEMGPVVFMNHHRGYAIVAAVATLVLWWSHKRVCKGDDSAPLAPPG